MAEPALDRDDPREPGDRARRRIAEASARAEVLPPRPHLAADTEPGRRIGRGGVAVVVEPVEELLEAGRIDLAVTVVAIGVGVGGPPVAVVVRVVDDPPPGLLGEVARMRIGDGDGHRAFPAL